MRNTYEKVLTKKQRRRFRSKYAKDMKPRIFDKVNKLLPYVFYGVKL